MPYEYTDSGLDGIVLQNGYTIHKTQYGRGVSITNVERLHREIGSMIIRQLHISGAELRFLRLELDKTQAELAALLGTSEQTVSLWERDRKASMPETAARLLRLLYAEHIGLNPKPSTWLERIVQQAARFERIAQQAARVSEDRGAHAFRHEGRGWKLAA
jgi:putative transcriptional regulator